MKSSPAFQFYPADFLMGTAIMSCEQRGAYIGLLCHQWHSHGLPDENHMLSRLAGCSVENIEAIRPKFTVCEDGLLRNLRLEDVRSKQDAYRQGRSESGKLGGRPKKHTVLKTKAKRKHSESSSSSSSSSSLTPTSTSPDHLPAFKKRVGGWFKRRESTAWSEDEEKKMKAIVRNGYDPLDLDVLESYYCAAHPTDKDYRRKDVITLLNNWNGEIDRARRFKPLAMEKP